MWQFHFFEWSLILPVDVCTWVDEVQQRILHLSVLYIHSNKNSAAHFQTHSSIKYCLNLWCVVHPYTSLTPAVHFCFTCQPCLRHTWHLLIFFLCSCPSLRVPDTGADANCNSGITVVSQKLYSLAKNWHVPRWPWHSMNGADLKSSRQLPGDIRDCPPPWSPDPVCWKEQWKNLVTVHENR